MTVVPGRALDFAELPGRRSADPLREVGEPTVSVRVVEVPAGGPRSAHRHPHSVEVVYVAAGRGWLWLDGTRTPVEAGDIVHIPRGAPHATVASGGDPVRLVCFFPHADLAGNLEELDLVVKEDG